MNLFEKELVRVGVVLAANLKPREGFVVLLEKSPGLHELIASYERLLEKIPVQKDVVDPGLSASPQT